MPSAAAAMATARFTPPLCATIASRPGGMLPTVETKVASTPSTGLTSPEVFGPSSRMPAPAAARAARAWSSAPSGPASANPPAQTIAARAPAAAHCSTTSGTAPAGTISTARSTGWGTAAMDG